jgi:hypothetical protein
MEKIMSMYDIRKAYETVLNESTSTAGRGLLIHLKKMEKNIDDMVDTSGDAVHAQFDAKSAEVKKWDELTRTLYDTVSELKQLFVKL